MATVNLQETFQVAAPIASVWRFLIDPRAVVGCLPGAELVEVIDEVTFVGKMRVRVGPITTGYQGRVRIEEADAATHTVRLAADGKEGGGGSVRGSMSSRLTALADGGTEVAAESTADITGKVAQFGRGMIQEVSHQLFLQFVACTRARLEAEQAAVATSGASPIAAQPAPATSAPSTAPAPGASPSASPAAAAQPVGAFSVTLRAFGTIVMRKLRALFARRSR